MPGISDDGWLLRWLADLFGADVTTLWATDGDGTDVVGAHRASESMARWARYRAAARTCSSASISIVPSGSTARMPNG